jgi:hypothetical protein
MHLVYRFGTRKNSKRKVSTQEPRWINVIRRLVWAKHIVVATFLNILTNCTVYILKKLLITIDAEATSGSEPGGFESAADGMM